MEQKSRRQGEHIAASDIVPEGATLLREIDAGLPWKGKKRMESTCCVVIVQRGKRNGTPDSLQHRKARSALAAASIGLPD